MCGRADKNGEISFWENLHIYYLPTGDIDQYLVSLWTMSIVYTEATWKWEIVQRNKKKKPLSGISSYLKALARFTDHWECKES